MKKILYSLIATLIILSPFTFVNATPTYKVPHWLSYIGSAGNGVYLPVTSTHVPTGETDEAITQVEMTFAGSISELFSRTRAANTTGSTTFTLRKNGVDTAITWTVAQNATGEHGDFSDTVTFVAGDVLSISVTTTAGSISELTGIGFKIQSDDGKTRRIISTYNNAGVSFSTLPRFLRPEGEMLNNLTTDAVAQILNHNDSVIEAISVYVEANTRNSTATFTPRINGTNGSLSRTVNSTSTGRFTTSGGTQALLADDLLNINFTAGGTGTLTVNQVTLTIASDNEREITLMHGNNTSRNNATSNQFDMAGGRMSTSPTELAYATYLRSGGVLSQMSYYASASSATANLQFNSRVNGADGSMTITMNATGWFTDTTNTNTIDDNDYVGTRHFRVASGTGTTTLRANSVLFTMDEIVADTFIPIINWF